MTEIEITKDGQPITYSIPSSWDEVTVKQFRDWSLLLKEAGNNIETIISSASVFSGIPEETLWAFPYDKLNVITDSIKFITDPIEHEPADSIIIGGEEYFIKKDFNDLTIGEVRAIDQLSEGSVIENLNHLLTIFCRRKQNGEWEPITNQSLRESDKFNEVKITDVWRVFSFFVSGVTL
jgi:hypothetical protein